MKELNLHLKLQVGATRPDGSKGASFSMKSEPQLTLPESVYALLFGLVSAKDDVGSSWTQTEWEEAWTIVDQIQAAIKE